MITIKISTLLAKQIKEFRLEKGVSRKVMGDAIGISETRLRTIECKLSKTMTGTEHRAIRKYLLA